MNESLHIVISAVDPPRAAALARDARELGHDVWGLDPPVDQLRAKTPDVILVGRAGGDLKCLSMVALAAHELDSASIVVLHAVDGPFAEAVAERGAFACLSHSGPQALATALAVAHLRHLDHRRLLEAFVRRAIIEQAKGILMTRNGISSNRAFALLRRHSHRSGRKIVDIAQAVVNSHALLFPSPEGEPATESMLAALAPRRPEQRHESHVSGSR
jgi:AmiR/NasT family two-component response regulator